TSGMGLVLGGRARVVLTGHADASWVDNLATQRLSQGYTFSLGSGSVSWRSTRSSSVLSSICEAEIYAGAMAAQELRWLTYLLTDLGEAPRSPPVLDARYRAAAPAELLDKNQPPMFISLYFIVTRLPDSLRSVRDHFFCLDPTSLTVDLLEQHLVAAETSAVAIAVACGTPRSPFFEGCSPSPLAPSYASAAAAADVSNGDDVGAASASAKCRSSKDKGGKGGGGGRGVGGGGSGPGGRGTALGVLVLEVASVSSSSVKARPSRPSSFTCGRLHTQHRCFSHLDDTWRAKFGDDVKLPRWADLLRSRIAIFDLDFDAILSAMYALSVSVEGDSYQCVPRDPVIAVASLGASEFGTLPGPAEALHTFTLDSGASTCFFRDSTTLTPLSTPIPVRLANPCVGPVVARSSTVLPCAAVPSGSPSGLHLPSFSANLVSTAALQDAMVTTTTPGGQRVTICTCTRTGRHLATFTRRPGSSLYTLATEPPQAAVSAQVSASGQVAASFSCRLLSHQTLLWHRRLGHPSLPRLRGMHSRLLVSGLPRSLPPLPPSPAPPCLPCVEGRQCAAPHSSSFPSTFAPLQTLHMDVWGPARVSGQSHECYFLLVVDDYTRCTTIFPLRSKGQVVDVLIPWIRTVRLQLSERFGQDLPVLRLHSDRGGEFSSNLLRDFCRGEGILQSFTLPDSPQQNGIVERRIGLVMEVARTSMIHAAAPHFLWPFAVRYAAHQLNLWPRVSLLETSPTLRWTGEVNDASVFRVWGSRAFVRDTFADKLSPRAIPCQNGIVERRIGLVMEVARTSMIHAAAPHFLWTFAVWYAAHQLNLRPRVSLLETSPTLRWTGEVNDASVFRVWGSRAFVRDTFADKLSPRAIPCDVTFDESVPFYRLFPYLSAPPPPPPLFLAPGPPTVAVGSGVARGAASGGAEPGGAESEGAGSGGAELGGEEPGGAEPVGEEPDGAEQGGAESEGAESGGAEPQIAASSGAGGARDAGAGGAGVTTGAGGNGSTVATCPGGARTRGTGAPGTGGVEGAGAGDPTEPGAAGAGGTGAGGAGAGGAGAGGAGAAGAGAVDLGAGGAGDTVRLRLYFAPLLQQSVVSLRLVLSCLFALLIAFLIRILLLSPAHTLWHSVLPLRVPLPAPPESSLLEVPDPESDRARAVSPTVARLLTTAVTDPSFESAAAFALVAELLDFAATSRLDYATALIAESASASPPFVGGECALGMDVLEDEQEDFECLAAAVPRFASMLLAHEGDPDAPDIPTPRSYAEAIIGPYSSQWHVAMDAEMASYKSKGTFVDEVPPPWSNIVDCMWIFRVKRPRGSPPAFKARYVARGFSQRQGVDYFQTFSPTPKMTTLWVLLHVAAQRDYELHSLDFSTAFLQGSPHEEIWLRRQPGFTESFRAGTGWSLWRPVYGLRQAPREWHATLRTTLATLGFAPATADPSLFLRTDTSLPPFYVLVYFDNLIFATADTEALTLVKSGLQKRHTCTDLGELHSYLGLQITRDRARRTITLTQSHMVHQVL
ncbi:unnamed protein product, partial [Closterium sp. NIES-54]